MELRNEIDRLEKQLRGFDGTTPQEEISKVEKQLDTARSSFTQITSAAAKAGATIDGDFKSRIYEATQVVNALSAKVIDQRAAVRENENAVRALGEAYRDAVKKGNDSGSLLAEYKAAKHALEEDKYLLGQLTTEEAKAKLAAKELKDEYASIGTDGGTDVIEKMTGKMREMAATIMGGIGIKEFVGKVVSVRGEFEDIETKLKTMLGSEEKMRDLMAQLKDYALVSPLTTKDMSSALQMMIGFGIDADKSVEYLKALGDISMGNTQSFNSLALAFSQMSAAGKLMGQDLNQMINAGFNPLQTMSEKTGKSIGALKKEMSDGAITAEMVQQAFLDATSEGGKFHGMAEAGAKTINGQLSMLEESFDNIFNDIGTKSEGVILSAISGATSLVESYETIGNVIGTVVSMYGGYKAAVLLVNAVDKARKAILLEQRLAGAASVAATEAGVIADAKKVASSKAAAAATLIQKKAQEALNKAMLTNPYVLAGIAIGTLAYGVYKYATAANAAEVAQKSFNDELDRMEKTAEDRKQKILSLVQAIQNPDTTKLNKQLAFDELAKLAPALTELYGSVNDLEEADLSEFKKSMDDIASKEEEQGIRDKIKALQDFIKLVRDFQSKGGYAPSQIDEQVKSLGIEVNWTTGYDGYVDAAQGILNNWQAKLNAIEKAKEEIAEPTELEVKLKEEEYERCKSELEAIDSFAVAMKDEIEGRDITIPLERESAEKETDIFIKDMEDKIAALQKEQDEHPLTFSSDKQEALDEYTSLLSDIKSWKAQAQSAGYFFIPLEIQLRMTRLQAKAGKKGEAGEEDTKTFADVYDEREKAYNSAKRKLEKINKHKSEYTQKEYDAAKEELAKAKKQFEAVGGNTTTDKQDASAAKKEQAKREKEQANAAKKEKKAQKDLEKELNTLRSENEKNEVANMADSHEKKLREIDREYKEELRKAKEQAEKMSELNKAAKTPGADKTVEIGGLTVGGLTQEQADELGRSVANADTKKGKAIEEIHKQELEDMREYNRQYGDRMAQRLAIVEEWDAKIAEAKTEGARKSAQAGKKQALADFDFETLQKSPEYVRAFKDLGQTGTGTLSYLLEQFQEAMNNQSIDTSDPEKLQKYVSVIQQLQDELDDREPFEAFKNGMASLSEATRKRQAAQAKLTKLEKEGKKGTKEYAATLEELNAATDEEREAETKISKAVDTVNGAIDELAGNISGLGDTIGGKAGEILGFIGNVLTFATTVSESIKTVGTATATAMSTIEKASAILAIVQAAIQLMQALSSLLPDAHAQYEKYAEKVAEINKMTGAVNDYRIAVAEANAEENQWLSGKTLRSLQAYAKVGAEALDAYTDKLYEAQATYQNESGAGWLTKVGHWVSKAIDAINPLKWASKGVTSLLDAVGVDTDSKFYKTLERITDIASSVAWKGVWLTGTDLLDNNVYEYEEGQTAAIDNLRIQTRKASKGFLGTGIGGKSEKTEDLRTWTKENLGLDLFDENNMLDTEVAQTILDNYGDKLVGETKATLEYLKEMQEQYDEWKEELEEYVSELYSPVIENFTDALWDWLDEGKDALDSFKDYASDTFRDIVTDMMKTIMLNDFLDEYSDTIKSLYEGYGNETVSYAELIAGVTSATGEAMETYEENLPVYKELLGAISDTFSDYGIDLQGSGSSSQDSTYGSASSITEEQADEISGRLTAVQESGYQRNSLLTVTNAKLDAMLASQSTVSGIADDMRDIIAKSYIQLQLISENTEAVVKPIKNISEKIDKIEKKTSTL